MTSATAQPHFSFSSEGIIWQVLPDSKNVCLILEIRHSNHTVSFAAIDLWNGTVLWKDLTVPESWWSSGVLVYDGILFLQTFPEGHNPDPEGIVAIQVSTKRILWQQEKVQFVQLLSDHQLLARIVTEAQPVYYILETATGKILSQTDTPSIPTNINFESSRLKFPVQYISDDKYFPIIADFLQQTLNISAKNAFDYVETQHCIIISYYIYAETQVENYLVAFDTHSRVPLLHEKLATQRTGIGKDTFFIFDQYLIFVKEQSVLLSYEL